MYRLCQGMDSFWFIWTTTNPVIFELVRFPAFVGAALACQRTDTKVKRTLFYRVVFNIIR